MRGSWDSKAARSYQIGELQLLVITRCCSFLLFSLFELGHQPGMTDLRRTYRPESDSDLLGYLRWEYDRLRFLTMLRSAEFAYGHSDSAIEMEKGRKRARPQSNLAFGPFTGTQWRPTAPCESTGTKQLQFVGLGF